MLFFQQSDFLDRDNLPDFLNRRGLKGYGVEVGTHRGDYAKVILEKWEGRRLDCIDPWENSDAYKDQAVSLWGGARNREEDYDAAFKDLNGFGERVRLIRDYSPQAANKYQNNSLDFVYIDGDHKQVAVACDLWAWYPKLKTGGILAGHDIVCPGELPDKNWGKEIQPAVLEFCKMFNTTCYLIVESLCLPWSYYFIRS